MRRSKLLFGIIGLLTIFGMASLGGSQEPAAPPKANPKDPIEVLTSGPIHEAFAQPFNVNPGPGPVVPKEPPPAIQENPPDQKPAGDNVEWIPGYWSWDPDRQDYVWTSGVYRVPPQGQAYVPGYWQNTSDGWRWVQGFWSNAQSSPPYTPEPPATLDNGPSMPQPNDNSIYIPGAWVYNTDRFVWRPGYYAPVQQGRVWTPPRYIWTPSGYVFVDGYWDYPLDNRGLAFAPVYFNSPLWMNPGWGGYTPGYALGLGSFYNNAFVYGPNFWFGNYYNPRYGRLGYSPWYNGRGRYDPVFAYHGWQNYRNNPNWITGVQQNYAGRGAGRAAIPAVVNTPLSHVRSVNLVKATPTQLQAQRTHVQQTRQLAVNRQQADTHFVKSGGSPHHVQSRSFSTAPVNHSATRITTPGFTPHVTGSAPRTITTPHVTGAATPRVMTTPHVMTTPSTSIHRPTVTYHTTPQVQYHSAPIARPTYSAPRISTYAPAHMGGAHIGGAPIGGAHIGGAHIGGAHIGGGHMGGGGHHR